MSSSHRKSVAGKASRKSIMDNAGGHRKQTIVKDLERKDEEKVENPKDEINLLTKEDAKGLMKTKDFE